MEFEELDKYVELWCSDKSRGRAFQKYMEQNDVYGELYTRFHTYRTWKIAVDFQLIRYYNEYLTGNITKFRSMMGAA